MHGFKITVQASFEATPHSKSLFEPCFEDAVRSKASMPLRARNHCSNLEATVRSNSLRKHAFEATGLSTSLRKPAFEDHTSSMPSRPLSARSHSSKSYSKSQFEITIRSHCSKSPGNVPQNSVPLDSAPLGSVHGYARVRTSIYIYIYIYIYILMCEALPPTLEK